MVRVVSKQLDSVRVEQNHCQGLQTVRASYKIHETEVSASLYVKLGRSP